MSLLERKEPFMKKYFPILILLLLLTACGGEQNTADTTVPSDYVSTSDAAQVVARYLGWEDLSPLEQEDRDLYLNELYCLEEGSWTEATIYAAQGTDARELAVIRLSDPENDVAAANAVEEYRKARQGDFFGYFPAQAVLVEKGMTVIVPPGYVALFICEDPDGAVDALMAVLNGEEPPQPRPTPSAPSEDEPIPTLDISSFIPFDPPNRYHIRRLYATTPILEAYASGDESELSQRNAALLARCKEAMECITEDMTDFEKELALRDWMLEQGTYDETVLSGKSFIGQKDNTNPYGYLVSGYGICYGYATTFQLLMDLAGVECITVIGAAFDSTEDHAWNMVKLEDEWYCVDTTWDMEGDYNFFNVTSDHLRGSNHQWDYENVPEATATRFYWNGFGEKPE